MNNKYMYLFPFEKVPAGSRVLIYGAGDVGIEYLQQIIMTGYCECVGFVDKAWDKMVKMVVPVFSPTDISKLSFDYIILAFKTDMYIELIYDILKEQNVSADKVIKPVRRSKAAVLFDKEETETFMDVDKLAFQKDVFSIALKYGPGIGDAIIKKRLFIELERLFPTAKIDIYAPCPFDIIYSIYRDRPGLGHIVEDTGALYQKYSLNYTMALQAFFILQFDSANIAYIKNKYSSYLEDVQKLKKGCQSYDLKIFPQTQSGIHLRRMMYRREKCFSFYDYTDVIHNKYSKVDIPIDADWSEFNKLALGEYVTFNFGNGISQKEGFIPAKQWPYEYYEKFIGLFKKKYPSIKAIQIGAAGNERIKSADKYFMGKNFELVKQILSKAIFHFDIEGGIMHLASNIGTKCIVVYGPTQMEIFSYDDNINIVSNKCRNCYGLSNDWYKCFRNLQKPECMWSITPEMVMKKVEEYLDNILNSDES